MTVTGTTSKRGPFTLTGYIAGNVVELSGAIGGVEVEFYGIHAASAPGVIVVNMFDPAGNSLGVLTQQMRVPK